jgi:hypothetical protein
MRAWLTANRWFLIALVVLIPAAVVVSLIPRFLPYLESRPQPEAVALGEVVRYSGADIELTGFEVLDGDEWNAPLGADVVVATLAIDVVEPLESPYCKITLVSTDDGVERIWDAELYPDSDYEIDDRFEQLCRLDERGSYELQTTFLVPSDGVTQPAVQLSSSAESPRVLRLR